MNSYRNSRSKKTPIVPSLFRFMTLILVVAFLALFVTNSTAYSQNNQTTIVIRLSKEEFVNAAAIPTVHTIDYGSFVWLELTPSNFEKLRATGANFEVQYGSTTLRFQDFSFDTRQEAPAVPLQQKSTYVAAMPSFFIVQLLGPTKSEWTAEMRASGLEILQYFSPHSYLVRMPPEQVNIVESFSFTRWVGPYHPAFRVSSDLLNRSGVIENINVTIYDDGRENGLADQTIKAIEALGGKLLDQEKSRVTSPFVNAIFALPASSVSSVAQLNDVVWINQQEPEWVLEDEMSSQIVAGNFDPLEPGYSNWLSSKGVDGTGVTVALVDTGYDTADNETAHPDVRGRLIPIGTPNDTIGHGTHVGGIIAGNASLGTMDSDDFLFGLGVAPNTNLVVRNLNDPSTSNGQTAIQRDSVVNGAVASNNSYVLHGAGIGYTGVDRTVDELVRDANPDTDTIAEPLIIVFSAGNSGTAGPTKEAKNIIAVGATENQRDGLGNPGTGNITDIASDSSRGPTGDGRVYPHVVAPGVNIVSTRSTESGLTACNTIANGAPGDAPTYSMCSGTSMAAPHVTGAVALITEWWRGFNDGSNPSPAMAKALLVNGAEDIGAADIPNNNEGWGRINLNNVIDTDIPTIYLDQSIIFDTTGETWSARYVPADPNRPVKVTIVWIDAAGPGDGGNPNALVNDLDLLVNDNGTLYRGNAFSNGFSTSGGTADQIDNLENVFIENPGDSFRVTVVAAGINGDGIPYNGDTTDQDVAIVIQNAVEAPGAIRAGFDSNTLPANDDGSTGLVPLGFSIDFFGSTYTSLFVNNNGNVTFGSPLGTFTPFDLNSTNRVIIAPFFADVDTRAGNVVSYGSGTIGGRPAFGVNWPDVGCYNQITSVLNDFQVLLIDRSDIGLGDFDIEFNYEQIQWETGQASGGDSTCQRGFSARVGYSNGSGTSFELPGSGINGTFLDTNLETGLVYNSRNSLQGGRYVFEVRNGVAPIGGTISGQVFANSTDNPVSEALVQICGDSGFCNTTSTNISGLYSVSGLEAGQYEVTAFPPANLNVQPGVIGPIQLPSDTTLTDQNIILTGPIPPPPGTTVTNLRIGTNGVPIIYWRDDLALTTQNCPGGTGSYEVIQDGTVIRNGTLSQNPAGTYTAVIPSLFPSTGYARVVMTFDCPGSPITSVQFDIYIDPSGHVRTVGGIPIQGATVTLFRSDSSSGPFEVVENGSAIMAPENRDNPDMTNVTGRFGWNVIAGFYRVRAEAEGCVSPTDPLMSFVESDVLTIPPPVTDLDLRLDCLEANQPPTANAGGPYESNEGEPITLDASGSSDPDDNIALYEWDLDNDGEFDDATGITADVTFGDNGTFIVGLRVTDDFGESDTDTAEVTINNVNPGVNADPATQEVQYSDYIADVTVTATDIAADPLQVAGTSWSVDGGSFTPGLPDNLALVDNSCTVSDDTNTCTWTLSGIANVAQGTYTVKVTVNDGDGGQSDAEITITVLPEDATVAFDSDNPVAVQVVEPGGNSGPFSLTAYVSETQPDQPVDSGASGDISLVNISMNLVPVGPGSPVDGACIPGTVSGSDYDALLPVTCSFDDVEVNAYTAQVTVGGDYYAGNGEDVLVIYDPSLGFTTGGGWFYWPDSGERTNFGFTMKYNKKGQKVQGNLLLIRHLPDGSIYRVKSNALNGLALGENPEPPFGWASFSGKSTYLEPGWPEPEGNHEFLVYVEDRDEPGTGIDRFWIEVKDKNGVVIPASSMDREATDNAVELQGGNIVVPHVTGRDGISEDYNFIFLPLVLDD